MAFTFAVLLVSVQALVFIKINPVECAYDGISWDSGFRQDQKAPAEVMVDVVNKFALSLLMVHNENNHEENIALSPYGVTSVLVALAEGLVGEGASEIGHALNLPADISVMRVGFRDILRHLKSYFIPKEGFLAGLTLSHENITLSKNYKDILNFYGYDIDNFNNPSYPSDSTMLPPTEGTTSNAGSEGREDTGANSTPVIEPVIPTKLPPGTTTGTNSQSTNIPTTGGTKLPPTTLPGTVPNTNTPVVPGEKPATPSVDPATSTVVAPSTGPADTPTADTPTAETPTAPPSETPTAPTAETPTAPPAETPTAEIPTVPTPEVPPAEAPAAKRRKRSLIDYEIAKYYDNYYMNKNSNGNRRSYDNPNINTRRSYKYTDNTNRRIYNDPYYGDKRSYDEPRFIAQDYIPEEPYTFLIDGLYRESNIDFMTYDTVLPFTYIPGLEAMALSFPLDSSEYYLLLILPINELGIDALIDNFKRFTSLGSIVRNLKYSHVKAIIPSFELKGNAVLTHSLQKLCIKRIFEPRRADFSKMTSQKDIYVTNIEQSVTVNIKNYMDPDKMYQGDMGSYRPVIFRADHPFLYFVMDVETNVNLMAGKVVNPLNSRVA